VTRHLRLLAALACASLGARLLALAHALMPRPEVKRYVVDGVRLTEIETLHDAHLTQEEAARHVEILRFGLVESAMARRFQRAAPERARA
jgi:hypothetical protein